MASVNSRKLKPLPELTVKHIQVIEQFEKLLEQGISNLTMSDIATKLKVSLRTLYEIAPSKEHLIISTLDRVLTNIGQKASTSLQEVQSPLSKLKIYIEIGNEAVGPKITKFTQDLNKINGALEMINYHTDYFIGSIKKLLDEAVEQKEILDIDTQAVAIALGGVPLMISDIYYEGKLALKDTPEATANIVANLILESLERRS